MKGFSLFAYGIIACLLKKQLKAVGACELNEVADDETHTRKSAARDAAAIVTLLPSSPKHRARGEPAGQTEWLCSALWWLTSFMVSQHPDGDL